MQATPEAIARAAEVLRRGGLVAFPTETVYGLGASALDPAAAARIFSAKGRPRFDPLICHLERAEALETLAAEVPPLARRLAARFWPGPLTLVLLKHPSVPDLVTAAEPTVALRVPAHPAASALLRAFGGPVAAPSANRFGQVSPSTAAHVAEQLPEVELVLDGGPCPVGVESTIASVLPGEPVRLLRPGGVPLEALEAEVGPVEIPPPRAHPRASPGRLARHYAPRTPLALDGSPRPPAERVGRLAFAVAPPGYAAVEVLSPAGELEEAARNLFSALRRLDARGLDLIEAEAVPETGLGRAIMDRLRRAEATRLPSAGESA